ncbi:hypothetical protein Y1Q_0008527 [Alligator mississippiensis]|uniref:Uncharacterized protein n=1 Tax=Alligator mississippiensis TaxID=8496 RepID=A0A151M1M5_ALLMI|nr:hypothetical protein Y1Q_0008527 [Alligator mississippiensis]
MAFIEETGKQLNEKGFTSGRHCWDIEVEYTGDKCGSSQSLCSGKEASFLILRGSGLCRSRRTHGKGPGAGKNAVG